MTNYFCYKIQVYLHTLNIIFSIARTECQYVLIKFQVDRNGLQEYTQIQVMERHNQLIKTTIICATTGKAIHNTKKHIGINNIQGNYKSTQGCHSNSKRTRTVRVH